MPKLIVNVDSREKYPVLFPATIRIKEQVFEVQSVISRLSYGDYSLSCDPTGCVIERKGSQAELLTNLFDPIDMPRACRAFARLADYARRPVLLLDMRPSELLDTSRLAPGFDPDDLLSRLYQVVAKYNFLLLFAGHNPDRRVLGRHLLSMMAHFALASGALILDSEPVKNNLSKSQDLVLSPR